MMPAPLPDVRTNRVLRPFMPAAPTDSAYEIARQTCEQWGVRNFQRELEAHLQNGFVFCLPRMFAMAKVVQLEDGRRAWHVAHAHGQLWALLSVMPFPLDWIVFERRGDRRSRIYSLPRLQQLASALS